MTEAIQRVTGLDEVALNAFRGAFAGEIILAGEDDYDEARKIWNGMIDKRPALLVRPTNTAQVVQAVNFAREQGLLVAVRCGGHNVAGNGLCEGGIVIDLSAMRRVRVDPTARRAWAEGGCLLGDVDRATQEYGLAVPAGVVSQTGLSGLALGGGIGWLARIFGLTVDNIAGAEVVTAAGEIVRASETENSDLLWGLRGGGGNFGIVTEFELKLHPLDGPVLFGSAIYPLDQAKTVLENYREFVKTETDETHAVIGLRLCPPFPFLPPEQHFKPVVTMAIVYVGDHAEGRRLMQPLLGFGTPLVADAQPIPYLALQQSLDAASPDGAFYYSKAGYLTALTDEIIDRLVEAAARINSPITTLELGYLHGAISRVADDATAFSNRQADYIVNLAAGCPDPTTVDATVAWVRQSWASLNEFMTGGVYVNFMSNDEQERIEAAYGSAKYRRLVALKDKYDPHNLFRLNQNIRPSQT